MAQALADAAERRPEKMIRVWDAERAGEFWKDLMSFLPT